MNCRRLIPLALVLAAFTSPNAALADEITLNVPVRLTRMAAIVTRGLVTCDIVGRWNSYEDSQTIQGRGTSNFAIPASGDYNGTIAVRILVSPP